LSSTEDVAAGGKLQSPARRCRPPYFELRRLLMYLGAMAFWQARPPSAVTL